MQKSNYLSAQLRESAPYLKDAGWHQVATLIIVAADEIETLRQRLAKVEGNPTWENRLACKEVWNVRFWHDSDLPAYPSNVRYRG